MTKRTRTRLLAAAALGAALAGGIGVASAAGSDRGEEPDVPISGGDLQRAGEAALAETGGGRVTDTEVGDEESYYEVEVTLGDGRQVDVQLDESFTVVGSSADVEDDGDEGE